MKTLSEILKILDQGKISADHAEYQILDLFENSIKACKTVVNRYELDGMENMNNRDEVFYKACKLALDNLKHK